MNLSPIAKAINSLCHELTPPPGAEPPTPWGGSWNISWDIARLECSNAYQLLEEVKVNVERFCGLPEHPNYLVRSDLSDARWYGGAPGGPKRLDGWWAKVGGNPPTFWPHQITPKDIEDAWKGLFNVSRLTENEVRAFYGDREQAIKVWYDEASEIDPIKFEHLEILRGPFFPPR